MKPEENNSTQPEEESFELKESVWKVAEPSIKMKTLIYKTI